jgi:hypothetical protein
VANACVPGGRWLCCVRSDCVPDAQALRVHYVYITCTLRVHYVYITCTCTCTCTCINLLLTPTPFPQEPRHGKTPGVFRLLSKRLPFWGKSWRTRRRGARVVKSCSLPPSGCVRRLAESAPPQLPDLGVVALTRAPAAGCSAVRSNLRFGWGSRGLDRGRKHAQHALRVRSGSAGEAED